MICPNCGREIPDESLFCGECGADLNQFAQAQQFQQPQEPIVEPTVEMKNEPVKNDPNGSNTMSLISLILGIVGVILLFFVPVLAVALSIAAIILGLMGRKIGARSMGTAGLVLGIIVVAIVAAILIFFVATMIFGVSMMAISA